MTGKGRDSDQLPRPITDHRMDATIADVEAAARNAQVGGLYGPPAPCRHSFPNHSVDWRRATCERCGTPIVEVGPIEDDEEPGP